MQLMLLYSAKYINFQTSLEFAWLTVLTEEGRPQSWFKVGSQRPFPLAAHKVWENHSTALCKLLSENLTKAIWSHSDNWTQITPEEPSDSVTEHFLCSSVSQTKASLQLPGAAVPLLCCSTETRASSELGEKTRAGRYTPRTAAGESSKWHAWNLCILISDKKYSLLFWVFFNWLMHLVSLSEHNMYVRNFTICMWELHF